MNNKDYDLLQQSRNAIGVINKRLFPITDLPLLDKFLIDCMLRRRRLSQTFPEWSSVNRLPIGIAFLICYASILTLSASYSSIIFIGIASVACLMGYRAKWLMDRLYVLGNHNTTKRAVLLAASGLLTIKGFNRDYDEDFLKPALVNYLKGSDIDALKFINMYVELVYALTPTSKEVKFLREQFDDLIKTSSWAAKGAEKPSTAYSKKDSVEFINKDLTVSNNEKFTQEDQGIEDSLAFLVNRSDLEESVAEEAEEEANQFTRLLTDKAYFDESYTRFKKAESVQTKDPASFDSEDMTKFMMEQIRANQAEQKSKVSLAKESRTISTVKPDESESASKYRTPPKAIPMEESASPVTSLAMPIATALVATELSHLLADEMADTPETGLNEHESSIDDNLATTSEGVGASVLIHEFDDLDDPFGDIGSLPILLVDVDGELPPDSLDEVGYDHDLHNRDAFTQDNDEGFDFDNIDKIEIEAAEFQGNLRDFIDEDE